MDNYVKCRDGGVDLMIDGQRWMLTPAQVQAFGTRAEVQSALEARGGRALPPGVHLHRNRDGSIAVALGTLPQGFVWPEDEGKA